MLFRSLMYGLSYTYKTTWLKIKPSSSGSIVFLSAASNTVQLCNAKKRPLSPARIVGDQYTMRTLKDVYFGVKGKTTYYLKLNGSGLRSGQLNQYLLKTEKPERRALSAQMKRMCILNLHHFPTQIGRASCRERV